MRRHLDASRGRIVKSYADEVLCTKLIHGIETQYIAWIP